MTIKKLSLIFSLQNLQTDESMLIKRKGIFLLTNYNDKNQEKEKE